MFRMHAFRTSRVASLASAGAAGVVVSETTEGGDDTAPAEIVADTLPSAANPTQPSNVVEPEPSRTVFPDLPEKLSIYPSSPPTLVLLDTPSPLELRIGTVRREVYGYYSGARTQVQTVVDQWIQVEEAVESRLKSFRDPAEPLNPGLLYTGISALTASVIVRSRALPVRFLLPPISFIGAFAYFLPRTAGRVGDWVEGLESKYAPRAGEIRRTSIAHTGMALGMLSAKYKEGKEGLGKGVRSVVEGIESNTGLRLSEVFGWTQGGDDKRSGSDKNKNA